MITTSMPVTEAGSGAVKENCAWKNLNLSVALAPPGVFERLRLPGGYVSNRRYPRQESTICARKRKPSVLRCGFSSHHNAACGIGGEAFLTWKGMRVLVNMAQVRGRGILPRSDSFTHVPR
jgi:hypothetical protein